MKFIKSAKKLFLFMMMGLCFTGVGFSQTAGQKRDINEVNAFDRLIMNPYSKPLDYVATGTEIITLLSPAVMFAAPVEDYWKIGLEYVETVALAYGAKELAKLTVSRARPYMYFDGAPQKEIESGDWENSFFSGHTTLSFAAATFTTFMFCQYFPDSPYKIPVITASYAMAAVTAGLRLASGNHFMTDVLCGAIVGSGIGFLVPWLNSFWLQPSSKEGKSNFSMNVSPAAFSIQYNF